MKRNESNEYPLLDEIRQLGFWTENEYTLAHSLFYQAPSQQPNEYMSKFDHRVIFKKVVDRCNSIIAAKLVEFGKEYLLIDDLVAYVDGKLKA